MEALIASTHQQLRSNAGGCGEPSRALCSRGVVWGWKEALLKEEPVEMVVLQLNLQS